ncbi:MAG TPA: EAL domain-containing protein [Candidatus Dormibacteraeota bacterium]|nr:EAL domain-containing protein [Candidatus Dormibacteraeota bacterium]
MSHMLRGLRSVRWERGAELGRLWRRHPQLLVAVPLVALAIALIPVGARSEARIPALLPAMLAVGLVADAATFALLMRLYRGDHPSPRLLGIAGCFVFSALLEVAFIAQYPHVLTPQGLMGGPADTAVWIWTAWHGGMILGLFGTLSMSASAWESLATSRSAAPTWISFAFWAVTLPTVLAAACVRGAEIAARVGPSSLHGSSYAGLGQIVPGAVIVIALLLAVPAARRMGTASSVERWAMATAVVAAATMGLAIMAGHRDSLGWEGAWVLWAISELVLALAISFELITNAQNRQLRGDLQRRGIAERLGRLEHGAPPGQIASAICAELVQLPLVDCAGLVRLDDPGRVTPAMACSQSDRACREVAEAPLPRLRARDLKARAAAGAFVEVLDPDDEGDVQVQRYLAGLRDAGVRAMAHAPIVVGKRVSGVISVCRSVGTDAQAAKDLKGILPILTDVAAIAAILLAPTVRDARASARTRREFETILARHSFRPVYQPIMTVDLKQLIGHEALTRFESGTAPDLVFTAAVTVDLDLELELACLRASVTEARSLDSGGTWLSLNVSPALLTSATIALAEIVDKADRPIVLELTEHVVIDGYGPVRDALKRLGPTVKLAVDDAGSGFASLRHILELRPDFVKLDISLVRDVDQDPVRQAMIAGLSSFAQRTGCDLVAEGVESVAELNELQKLGVPYVQGYLLGRPAPVALSDPDHKLIWRSPHARRRQPADVAATR